MFCCFNDYCPCVSLCYRKHSIKLIMSKSYSVKETKGNAAGFSFLPLKATSENVSRQTVTLSLQRCWGGEFTPFLLHRKINIFYTFLCRFGPVLFLKTTTTTTHPSIHLGVSHQLSKHQISRLNKKYKEQHLWLAWALQTAPSFWCCHSH